MSSSATFHRISEDNFKIIQQATSGTKPNYLSLAEDAATCTGSHRALEFILSLGQANETIELVSEIFNPKRAIGELEFDILPPKEKWEMYERGDYIPYLEPVTISKFANLLNNISVNDIRNMYDAQELNDNNIYPKVWHDENSADKSFNERHILEDFQELKQIFKIADKEKNYILVYIG